MMGAETILAVGLVTLAAIVIAATFALKGWQGWLELRKLEIAHGGHPQAPQLTGGRIEIADLKERVRKLEQIASGIEL
jgi:hypothetical protein